MLFQIDQNAREDFNLTSDGEFNAIKSLVLGKVHGKWRSSESKDKALWVKEHLHSFEQQLWDVCPHPALCRNKQSQTY